MITSNVCSWKTLCSGTVHSWCNQPGYGVVHLGYARSSFWMLCDDQKCSLTQDHYSWQSPEVWVLSHLYHHCRRVYKCLANFHKHPCPLLHSSLLTQQGYPSLVSDQWHSVAGQRFHLFRYHRDLMLRPMLVLLWYWKGLPSGGWWWGCWRLSDIPWQCSQCPCEQEIQHHACVYPLFHWRKPCALPLLLFCQSSSIPFHSPRMFYLYLSILCVSSWSFPAALSVFVFQVPIVMLSLPQTFNDAPVAYLTSPSRCTAEGVVLVNLGGDQSSMVWLLVVIIWWIMGKVQPEGAHPSPGQAQGRWVHCETLRPIWPLSLYYEDICPVMLCWHQLFHA